MRVEYPGAICHVMDRGDRREDICVNLVVEGNSNGYLKTACHYVHLNPVRAHLLGTEDRLLAYPWSSFVWYLAVPEHRPGWLRVDRLLGEHGIAQESAAGREEFERQMEAGRLEEAEEPNHLADQVDCGPGADWHDQRRQGCGPSFGPETTPRQICQNQRTMRTTRIPIYVSHAGGRRRTREQLPLRLERGTACF